MFLAQRLALDLELDDAAVQFVDLLGFGIDRHPEARGCLVHQVDGLVRQEPLGDVAVGQRRRGDDGAVGDPDAVMKLVFLLEPPQDRNRVGDVGFGDENRLEAPGQRRVLLDVLAVLVQGGRADAMEFAAREHGLEHVGSVHRSLGGPGADKRVQLVDEDDDVALRRLDLFQHRFQSLLELAAILGAGHHRTEVERHQPLAAERLGHVAVDDPLGEALDDRGLADAGLADQHRVVLGAPRQYLNGSPDLLVAPDHRVELARLGLFGEVRGVALERVIGLFRGGGVRAPSLAQLLDRGVERLRRRAARLQDPGRFRALRKSGAQQQALDRDIAVAGLVRGLLRRRQEPRGFARHIELPVSALDPGEFVQRRFGACERFAGVAAGGLDQPRAQAFAVFQQYLEDMFGRETLVIAGDGLGLGRLNDAARPFGVTVEFHLLQLRLKTLHRVPPATGGPRSEPLGRSLDSRYMETPLGPCKARDPAERRRSARIGRATVPR